MQCSKLNNNFLKVKAKVSGFLIARIEKRNVKPIPVIIESKKNTITGLQYLLNAFTTYMSNNEYLGQNETSSGISITTSSGQTFTLPFNIQPTVYATGTSAMISFTVMDDSSSSYTAVNEQLITKSAGYNIPIATASLSITKQSDEILTLTWIITISISTSGGINYIPTLTPQSSTIQCVGYGNGCGICKESSANSLYPNIGGECVFEGFLSNYPQQNFVTTQLFTDIFYNTYGKGSSNPFTTYVNNSLYIYTPYCAEYFIVAFGNFMSYNGGSICFTGGININPIYLQIYMPSFTEPYMGIEIEFAT